MTPLCKENNFSELEVHVVTSDKNKKMPFRFFFINFISRHRIPAYMKTVSVHASTQSCHACGGYKRFVIHFQHTKTQYLLMSIVLMSCQTTYDIERMAFAWCK